MTDEEPPGAWIFLSHSHNDLQEVRRIRDALESRGHNPLMFFLKCLHDDSELDDLIRREIEARRFFLLCDSANARASRWVQAEVEVIKQLAEKVYVTVDLARNWETQIDGIDDLSQRATVFLSYVRVDKPIAVQVHDALRAHDFRVFFDLVSLTAGSNWAKEIQSALDTALATGYVILLLSPEALLKEFSRHEVQYALKRCAVEGERSNVIPVLVRDREGTAAIMQTMPDNWEQIPKANRLDWTEGGVQAGIPSLLALLQRKAMP